MVYTDTSPFKKFVLVVLLFSAFSLIAYGVAGDRIREFLDSQNLLSQVTPISQTDYDYLSDLPNALAPLTVEDVSSEQALRQKFIETLFIHVDEFDETDAQAVEAYLKSYYGFPEPIPASVQGNITAAVNSFMQNYTLFSTSNTPAADHSAFMNQLQTILANHQISTNNYQSVKRSQTTRSLLEAFVEQLK